MNLRKTLVRLATSVALVGTALAASVVGAPASGAVPTWAPEASATIHPGVQTQSPSGQCTANFIFYDASNVYIGHAAHCTGTGGATETNGCDAGSHPVGTEIEIAGASNPGVMVYNSWITMQEEGETDENACQYNDLALIKIDPADVNKVNPTVPHWGGPTGVNTTGAPLGSTVYSYGNSSLRLGLTVLSPKTGISVGTNGDGWNHPVYTASPGIPGDSGSAFLDSSGRALGVLSTLAIAPLAGSNGVGDINHELNYMRAHTSLSSVQLADGTRAFNGNQLPIGA